MILFLSYKLQVTGTLTNNGSLNVTDLTGAGTLTNGSTGTLKLDGTTTISGLVTTPYGNIVKYGKSGDQTVKPVSYYILALKGSGIKTIGSGLAIHLGINISSGVVVDLTGTSTIQLLILNGVPQAIGTWGATGSGATNIDDTYFSGTGMVSVSGPTTTITIDSLSADSGISSTDFITNTAVQTIQATLSEPLFSAAGGKLYGSVDGGATYTDITSKVSGTAVTWNGVTLSPGTSSIKMKVEYGTQDGPIATQAYTLDTTAPTLMQVTQVPTPTTEDNAKYYFKTDEACRLDVSPLSATGGGVQTVNESGHPAPGAGYYLYVTGLVDGGTYSFNFDCIDQSGNISNTLNVGPFTAIVPAPPSGGGGGVTVLIPTIAPPVATVNNVPAPSPSNNSNKTAAYQFARSLKFGSYGDDVKHLQAFLNSHNAQIAAVGFGSPGNEILNFGSKTTAALAKYQKANGITPSVGFFGPITMKFVNTIVSQGK